MKKKCQVISSAISIFLALAASETALADTASDSEKCYGVVKAGFNDCATATASCAGSSTKDNQPDAFVFVPKGLCEKLVGGSLTAGKENKS